MKNKKEKIIEVVPRKGKKFKRFLAGNINIEFTGKPPYFVKESEYKYISEYFEIKKEDKKGGK